DPLNQVGSGLGHAPTGTRRPKPPALAAEWEQQLLVARVTAQPEETMRQDAALQVVVQFTLHIGGQAFRISIGVKGGEKGLQIEYRNFKRPLPPVACTHPVPCSLATLPLVLGAARMPSAARSAGALTRGCRDSPRPRAPLPTRASAQRLGGLIRYPETPTR